MPLLSKMTNISITIIYTFDENAQMVEFLHRMWLDNTSNIVFLSRWMSVLTQKAYSS